MSPLPCFSVPSQTADPVRVAMFYLLLFVAQLRFAPDAVRRNQFQPDNAGPRTSGGFRRARCWQRGLVALHFSELALFASQPDAKGAPDCPYRNRYPGDSD